MPSVKPNSDVGALVCNLRQECLSFSLPGSGDVGGSTLNLEPEVYYLRGIRSAQWVLAPPALGLEARPCHFAAE